MSAARLVAVAIVVLTIGMNIGTSLVFFETDFLRRTGGSSVSEVGVLITNVAIIMIEAVAMSYVLIGLVLTGRPAAGRIASVLLAGGFLFAANPFGWAVGGELVLLAPQSELANGVFMLGPLLVGPAYALILPGLAVVFPTGRVPSRRWVLPVASSAGAVLAGIAAELVTPGPIAASADSHNPFGIEGLPADLGAASELLIAAGVLGLMVLSVVAVLTRYRSGDMALRHQLRWFVAAVLLAAIPLPISLAPAGIGGPQWALAATVGLLLVPVAVGIAITRHRLYEIDRLISRTIGWALVTGVLAAVFVATLLGVQAILSVVTQGETLAVAVSTLVAFALFQPVRRRVQTAVDRRFDRFRYDSESTAHEFATVLRDEVDLSTVRSALLTAVDGAIQPVRASVWLRKGL